MTRKVLVIDDDPAVRSAFDLVLSDSGYSVSLAENGLQGVERALADRPDMVFLDLKMPGIDGVETLRRLKAIDSTLIVYIVTAFSNEFMDHLKAAHDEGLQFQLASKPLSSTQIRHLANSAVSRASSDIRQKLQLSLYIVSLDNDATQLISSISSVLSSSYPADGWSLDVVEVLKTPEKALENEIFATPMLMRELPKPVIRLMGDLTSTQTVMAAITGQHDITQATIII